MNYYFLIKDKEIISTGQCPCTSEGCICIEVSEERYNNVKEKGSNYYIYENDELILNPEYESVKVAELKEKKYAENDKKADEARYNQTFTITLQEKECEFDTKEKTQSDLLTAFGVCSQGLTYDGWVCNNGIEIDLTIDDVVLISAKFKELSNVYPKWNEFKTQIDNATTIEEVEAIEIDYEINEDITTD